ncbi:MAG: hypothetical protein WCI05_15130 [Myxococcales bacterium]
MGLVHIIRQVEKQARAHDSVYDAAREANPGLAPYPTLELACHELGRSLKQPSEARNAMILAFVAEQNRQPHALWQALLVRAFEPMLRRIRAGLRGEEEADQRVLMAFLEVVNHLPPIHDFPKVSVYLRVATERTVFREVNEARREALLEPLEAACDVACPGDPEQMWIQWLDLRTALEAESNAHEIAQVLRATLCEGESLQIYVARAYLEAGAIEHRRIYRRLQHQRGRLLGRLRSKPIDGMDAFACTQDTDEKSTGAS